MGASANLILHPYGALLVGSLAGLLSVVGFNVIQPWLAEHALVYDTCGIHNLHGMPGVAGGIVSIIAVGTMTDNNTGYIIQQIFPGRTSEYQALMQLVGLVCTLGISILGGLFTGILVKCDCCSPPTELFLDSEFWVMNIEDASSHHLKT